jgi:pimeloyl-ACP methyl ester carboxylesterase
VKRQVQSRTPTEDRTADVFVNGSPPLVPDDRIELREGYADVGDVQLHYVEAGDGPLIVLLHGFPEFWYGWRLQITPLAKAGFRIVAPDLRGYNLLSKPAGLAAYTADRLAEPDRNDVPNLDRVERLPGASHWVHHDASERVTELLIELLRERALDPSRSDVDELIPGDTSTPIRRMS